mmetsp:Transcript_94938/g.268124  ORF Transcript_94938/g.268124 Transcript_94938/m.268124 type:complete len:235 (+) Transcript_94938:78-782(+)
MRSKGWFAGWPPRGTIVVAKRSSVPYPITPPFGPSANGLLAADAIPPPCTPCKTGFFKQAELGVVISMRRDHCGSSLLTPCKGIWWFSSPSSNRTKRNGSTTTGTAQKGLCSSGRARTSVACVGMTYRGSNSAAETGRCVAFMRTWHFTRFTFPMCTAVPGWKRTTSAASTSSIPGISSTPPSASMVAMRRAENKTLKHLARPSGAPPEANVTLPRSRNSFRRSAGLGRGGTTR